MSTKDLSHTVIEGGRSNGNKWDRRYSHAEVRFDEKTYLKEVTHDPENWYDYDIEPIRKVYKGFDDKLGPIYRWLNSQIGRPWNDVHSEIIGKFDTRTTAGRHIVYDHLIRSVEITPPVHRRYYQVSEDPNFSHYRNDFYVDEKGALQKRQYKRRYNKAPACNTNQVANWLSGRVVGKVGAHLFWFIPADKNKKSGGVSKTWRTVWKWREPGRHYDRVGLTFIVLREEPIYKTDLAGPVKVDDRYVILGYQKVWHASYPSGFRQGNKLSPAEAAYFNKLPEAIQKTVLDLSPTNPVPVRISPYSSRFWY